MVATCISLTALSSCATTVLMAILYLATLW